MKKLKSYRLFKIEKRIEKPSYLDTDFYGSFYADLTQMSEQQLIDHWIKFGQKENRYPNQDSLLAQEAESESEIPDDFDWKEYLAIHMDFYPIKDWNESRTKSHYIAYAAKENRDYKFKEILLKKGISLKDLPEYFCWESYLLLNKNLLPNEVENKERSIIHYLEYGRYHNFSYYFNEDFYNDYYLNGQKSNRKEAIEHWLSIGRNSAYATSFEQLLSNNGYPTNIIPKNIERNIVLYYNSSTKKKDYWRLLLNVIKQEPVKIRFLFEEQAKNISFYRNLGLFYESKGEEEKAKNIYYGILHLGNDPTTYENLGNIFFRKNDYESAYFFYNQSIKNGVKSVFAYSNNLKSLSLLKDKSSIIDNINLTIQSHSESPIAEQAIKESLRSYWQLFEKEINLSVSTNDRLNLIKVVNDLVQQYSELYSIFLQRGILGYPHTGSLNTNSILIIGDYHVPQCIRYRIDQKIEQFNKLGYKAESVSWTDYEKAKNKILWHDQIIFYRVPALPEIIELITSAKTLGKIVFYEIDDLIFEPDYPPAIENYGDAVTPEEYDGLLYGMALFRAAANLCDYGIASTKPLTSALAKHVKTNHCFLHRNGLDSKNIIPHVPPDPSLKGYINIFYGSGTKAHNSDFINEALPSIQKILNENNNVKLTIVGHLQLPETFLEKNKNQVIQVPLIKDIKAYWNYLSVSDINLAVLSRDIITDSKSELKWFEAACFGIPSIVSETQNYLDVIHQNIDGIIVHSPDEWYQAINLLIQHPEKRKQIGLKARERVLQEYSTTVLAENLKDILDSVDLLHRKSCSSVETIEHLCYDNSEITQ